MFPTFTHQPKAAFKQYRCTCGYIYAEENGCKINKTPAGTRWHLLPDDWECPECDAGKDEFELVK